MNETSQSNETVRHNRLVGLLENLKRFIGSNTTSLFNAIKGTVFSVRVENQKDYINVSNHPDWSPFLVEIKEAIKNIPEDKETDLSPVLNAIQKLVERPEKEFPVYNDERVIEAMKAIEEAIKGIPETSFDTSSIEKPLKEIVKLLTPPPMPKRKKVEEVKLPVWESEEIFRDEDDEVIKVVNHYDTMDIVEEKHIKHEDGVFSEVWTKKEVAK